MNRKSVFALVLVFLTMTLGLSACTRSNGVEAAREPDNGDDSDLALFTDADFIEYAAEMHAGEMNIANLALETSVDPAIRQYANRVLTAHSKALEVLSRHTGEKRSPETKGSLDTEQHVEYLSPMKGAEFDSEFVTLMIADHKDASETYSQQINSVHDEELEAYAQNTRADLQNLLAEAKKLQEAQTIASGN